MQSKKQSMVEVETRTSMKGAASIRASVTSAKAMKPKESMEEMSSTINTEKNPPSEGIKVEIVKNAQIGAQSSVGVQPRIRASAPIQQVKKNPIVPIKPGSANGR